MQHASNGCRLAEREKRDKVGPVIVVIALYDQGYETATTSCLTRRATAPGRQEPDTAVGQIASALDPLAVNEESPAMDFQELIRVRRSIRGYKVDAVAEDVLHRVLGAGRIAPTAANLQPFHLIVVTEPATRARMHSVYARDWFTTAPAILVACGEPAKAWRRSDGFNAVEMDVAIVMDHIILAAAEEGLGTCWVCNFDEAKTKEILGIPAEVRVLAMTPLGYPSAEPRPFARKSFQELVHKEHW